MSEEAGRNGDRQQVVIVGGGPVGLGLAIELGQRGISVTVVERHPQPQKVPKGQNLTQRTMEHFHFWGAEAALRAARTIPKDFGIGGLTAYKNLTGPYYYDWLKRGLVDQFYFTPNERLPQYRTEEVLRARVAELETVNVLYGWQAETLDQNDSGVSVGIVTRDGTAQRVLHADYAVGCDGSRSLVREQAGMTQSLSDHDRKMVLLVFRSAELHALLERFPGKSYFSVLDPEFEGYWMFFGRVDLDNNWFFHAPVPQQTTRDNFDFAAYLHRAAGARFDVAFEHIGFWDLRFAIADTYRAGRIFIAGDAAHSHPPYGGYGINTGFEDARNLGWKLAARLQGWGGEVLLDSYSAERQPVFGSTASDFIEKSILTDRDFLAANDPDLDRDAFEREWAARKAGTSREVDQFEPNYVGSLIVPGTKGKPSAKGSHSFKARAGHHLAPAKLSSGTNVFDALGPGFTLVAVDGGEAVVARFKAAATQLGVPLTVVLDVPGAGLDAYGARYVLVRPDQFVAWAANDMDDGADAMAVLAAAAGL